MPKASEAYEKIVLSLKKRKSAVTTADVCSATALPLSTVRELLPKAADEYQAHLQVTQSGEILYTFPSGFKSRYRGFKAVFGRVFKKSAAVIRKILVFLFKVWTMVMLIGYFIFFLLLAIASVLLSIAARSSDKGGSGSSGSFSFGLFDLLFRVWFFTEITRPNNYDYRCVKREKREKRPMHKAVFSFIFGEGDPNKTWEEQKNKALITYIQENRGVISLAEYMAFTGENSLEAEETILSFCSKFSGSPEVTEEGTIVYCFSDLLLKSDSKKSNELLPPIKRLKRFSVNTKKMNVAFILINAVNLIFGTYFLFNSYTAGHLITELQYQAASYLYAFTHVLLGIITPDPVSIIRVVLGVIPVLFSVLFWLIPAVRACTEKKENEETKLSNLKQFGFSRIWASPLAVKINNLIPKIEECRPKNLSDAGDRIIKDIGAISGPEIEKTENEEIIYSFKELSKEKQALEKYRNSRDLSGLQLGTTVFDTEE
ncbi:MAG: hypothetical protein LBH16_09000 [Treponema sp.]|jgi:hypothetical protein|nr:hypothetical protein [Treponema sp.]